MLPEPRTAAGADALRALLARPNRALLALDYDGTLAPIVRMPGDARPAAGAMEALVACSAVFGTVALLTGRPALAPVRLAGLDAVPGLEHLVVLGHYGTERWTAHRGLASPPPHPGVADVRRVLPLALAHAPAGVYVEDKGLSVAVHTRGAADPEVALAEVTRIAARLAVDTGLELQHGRLFVELRPPGALDKGTALRAVVAETKPHAVLFAGDDLVDLPAFHMVRELRDAGTPAISVFVENPEAPPSLCETADLVVADQLAMAEMLAALAEAAGRAVFVEEAGA